MERDDAKGELVRIDQGRIRAELGDLVRGTVEETLNGLLEAEGDWAGAGDRAGSVGKGSDHRPKGRSHR